MSIDVENRLAIESACTRVVHQYAYMVDFRDYDGFADLFTEKCVFDVNGQTASSREEMRVGVARTPADLLRRHVTTNILIDVIDENSAHGVAYFTVYRARLDKDQSVLPALRPAVVGHYKDKFVKTAEGWKFAERIGVFDMMDPELNP